MPEEYIGKREFDGFGGAVREEFKQLRGDLTQVSAKIDMLLNGLFLALLPGWFEAFIYIPPTAEPVRDCLHPYPGYFGPFRNTCRFPVNGYDYIVSSVTTLFTASCPSAIIGSVFFVAINSINRVRG